MLWFCLFLAVYPYVVYPVLVRLLIVFAKWPIGKDSEDRSVTVIIAAHNEEECIESTVRNKLEQNYPNDRLNVIVVSDGSSDRTDEIVRHMSSEEARVTLIRQEPRQGKTAAINTAVTVVASDIVVFSDANSRYDKDAIRRLVANFADAAIGYVSGRMVYTTGHDEPCDDGGSLYMQYESRLREWESHLGSVVGVDGGVDAVRRRLYRSMKPDQLPDFVLPLDIVEQGYRVVFEPDAVLYEESLSESRAEFRMRVRVTLRAFWAIWDKRKLLNPKVFPLYSWQLLSHKLLRYFSVIPLSIGAGLAFFGARESTPEFIVAVLFTTGIVAALMGTFPPFNKVGAFRFCHYFALLNMASVVAALRFVKRDKITIWKPRLG